MDRVDYQNLRFSVECEFENLLSNAASDKSSSVNNVMRLFLHALAQQEVRNQRSRRDFKLFRKNPETIVPGWAFKDRSLCARSPK